ncbi:hypothetical protein [Paraburkholderia tropica]|uniref:hypothetical protein n=1 Tax=Paraburkholderia tropica TaxID=92647 RepID=UPI002AB697FA|nr:hypothetical protein [Paraburkholderia tropica]
MSHLEIRRLNLDLRVGATANLVGSYAQDLFGIFPDRDLVSFLRAVRAENANETLPFDVQMILARRNSIVKLNTTVDV